MMKNKFKLFVWTDFCPDYTSGMAVALAHDETKARKLVVKEYSGEPYQWGELHIYPVTKTFAQCISGGG